MCNEKVSFEYNNRIILYKIILKNKKNISIKVDNNGEVLIYSPYGIDFSYIDRLVKGNVKWIINQIDKKKEISLFDENKLIYKGDIYNIIINIKDKESIYLKDEFININSKNTDNIYIYKLITNWYKERALEILPSRVYSISKKLNLNPSKIFIKDQKTLWGSCNNKKEIRLNWRLILMKEQVMDYIIIHELCHIIHMNHSKSFWDLVEKYDSNYKKNKLWLKEKGSMIMSIKADINF
ncbi:SprT family zinc-dependent metalloprotease [Clostridium sp.]|uniref:M48 family metallopeptidase n=1 Tax=Clostridium sp. TaxID=1506 RepID=UPI00260F5A07|nr:SprT family zinc-dependent metalloprotease [Clostridium sp.]